MQGLAKHLAVEVTELDLNTTVSGFQIALDFSLGPPEKDSKLKKGKFGEKRSALDDENSTAGGDGDNKNKKGN